MAGTTRKEIYLVGYEEGKMKSTKLPSTKEVLSVFFYKYRTLNFSIQQSFSEAAREAQTVWENAEIPTRRIEHIISTLKKIYTEWSDIRKNRSRKKSATQQRKEADFISRIQGLFDIAHHQAAEANYEFLRIQRLPTRRGFISRNQIADEAIPKNSAGKSNIKMKS